MSVLQNVTAELWTHIPRIIFLKSRGVGKARTKFYLSESWREGASSHKQVLWDSIPDDTMSSGWKRLHFGGS